MKTVIFILSGQVDGDTPRERFRLRLQWAVDYYRQHHETEDIIFLVSGRAGNVNDNISMTHAEIGKLYILERVPDATVIKEDISVDTIGNFAFSKPLIQAQNPDKAIIVTSLLLTDRVAYLSKKILGDDFAYEFNGIHDELVDDPALIEKEANALALVKKLFEGVKDGDDSAAREILLYKTPYYFKGIIDDKTFFDSYWEGGFEHFLGGLSVRNKKK